LDDGPFGCIVPGFLFLMVCGLGIEFGSLPVPGSWGRYKIFFLVTTMLVAYCAYRMRAWKTAIGATVLLYVMWRLDSIFS
jgi:hypothetical protein